MHDEKSKKMVQDANHCASICLATAQHCLQQGGNHADPKHINMLTDCAQICQTLAHFASRDSTHTGSVAKVCADICQACAKNCDSFKDDAQMQQCATACRTCAETCSVS